jgi:hypothetical protein
VGRLDYFSGNLGVHRSKRGTRAPKCHGRVNDVISCRGAISFRPARIESSPRRYCEHVGTLWASAAGSNGHDRIHANVRE